MKWHNFVISSGFYISLKYQKSIKIPYNLNSLKKYCHFYHIYWLSTNYGDTNLFSCHLSCNHFNDIRAYAERRMVLSQ